MWEDVLAREGLHGYSLLKKFSAHGTFISILSDAQDHDHQNLRWLYCMHFRFTFTEHCYLNENCVSH